MINLYRNLSTHGLIRIGGIISDHTDYVPEDPAVPRTMKNATIIRNTSLNNLSDFARATAGR